MRRRLSIILWVTLLPFLGLLTACSGNDVLEGPQSGGDVLQNVNRSYLSVKVVLPSEIESRAESQFPDFVYGKPEENTINKIRFYFFNDNGEGADIYHLAANEDEIVNYDEFVNYYDWKPLTDEPGKSDNVEKRVVATIPLDINVETFPTKIVAVINPSQDIIEMENSELNDIRDAVFDFKPDLTTKNFVMSNSVYVNDTETNGRKIEWVVDLNENNFSKSREEAERNPVEIYVERIVARIDISFDKNLTRKSIGNHHNLFPVNYKSPETESPEEIYIEFLGWAVTSDPTSSRLLKKIDASWDDEEFFSSSYSWNAPDLHRSFWATNPETVNYNWYSYTDLTGIDKNGKTVKRNPNCQEPDVTGTMSAYTQENAGQFISDSSMFTTPEYPTKVIFAAQLINQDGNPVDIAEYNSKFYTLEGLKTYVANSLDMFRKAEDNEEATHLNKYVKIKPSDLDFETSMVRNGKEGPGVSGTYYVYFKLTDEAAQKKWYHSFSDEEPKEENIIEKPNVYISEMVFPAKIWKDGFTYYFFEIPHYEDSDGTIFPGVVRNFLYNATVNQVLSLGTPVYDPTEKIYPENPPKEGNQLDVTVKTLKWRIESEDVNFTW